MENIRRTKPDDEINISSLLDEAFGPGRLARSVYRLREIRPFIDEFSYVYLNDSKIAASISYSETYINNLFKGLLLGPLAVSPALKGKGHGKELVKYTINKIELSNIYDFIIVVGDLDYYSKFDSTYLSFLFGFSTVSKITFLGSLSIFDFFPSSTLSELP